MDSSIYLDKKIFLPVNNNLKKHPAFNQILEDINISIEMTEKNQAYTANRISTKIESNKITIYQYKSCFGNKPHTLRYNNRLTTITEMFLNEKGELIHQESTGEFIPNFVNDIQVSTSIKYSYNQYIYPKDSKQLIKIISIFPSRIEFPEIEKIRTLPWKEMPLINDNVKLLEEYKEYDTKTTNQIYLHMPKIENDEVKEMPTGLENYIIWTLKSDSNSEKGNIKEWINHANKGKIITKDFSNIDLNNDFSLIIMNSIYGPKAYTGEEINNLIKNT